MTNKRLVWGIGICGSCLANMSLVTGLVAGLRPQEITPQTSPTSSLDIQSVKLERTNAREPTPDTTRATQSTPERSRMEAGRVPVSRAQTGTPTVHKAARPQIETEQVSSAEANAPLQKPLLTSATALHPTPANTDIVAASAANPVAIKTLPPKAEQANVAVRAEQQVVSAAPAQGIPLSKSDTGANPLPASPPAAERVAAALTSPDAITATLAFSGQADREVDPVSLAAFQNFVSPDLAPENVKAMRDEISDVFDHVSCARIQATFDPETASLHLVGHIPDDTLRQPTIAALQSQMGTDILVSDGLRILPSPQCGALAGIVRVGLPQSTDLTTNPLLIGADTHVRELGFIRDDRLFFDVTAPDYDAYIYVDYFDANGNVLHLSPNTHDPLRRVSAESVFQVGARSAGEQGLQILVGPPYGQEIAVAFAASAPLYPGLRPLAEPAAPYLDWLRQQVATAREETPDFKGEWVYFLISTSER